MADANIHNTGADNSQGFPFVTVGATLAVLFVFLFLMWMAARKENPLESPKPDAGEVKAAPNLDEIRARNEAALNGVGAKLSRDEARGKLLTTLKGPNDTLPFPTPEPPTPPAPPPQSAPKKDEKKEDKKDAKEK